MNQPAPQNQHYVPKFILRNFLSNPDKEQVHVFSKKTGKGFKTSIKNIMAERRFHEFHIGDSYIASFEGAVCQIEEMLLPSYRSLIEHQRFDGTPEQKGNLSVFLAFQMLRTRSQRDMFEDIEKQLAEKLTSMGGNIEQIGGFGPLGSEKLVEQHIRFMKKACGDFAQSIGLKDFILMAAPKGRSFYLSDNPVTLHNSQPKNGIYGNMGLQCKGIEIYLPLSKNLMLAAWCPTILASLNEGRAEQRRLIASAFLSPAMASKNSNPELQDQIMHLQSLSHSADEVLTAFKSGTPVVLSEENLDFQNSLLVSQARDHIVCQQADFKLARRFIRENGSETGRRLSLG